MPGKLPYVATKGAIEAFTMTLATEVASRGITVQADHPLTRRFLVCHSAARLMAGETAGAG